MDYGQLSIRKPVEADGLIIWEMVHRSGTLDLNSAYCYIMLGKYFPDTCAIAEADGRPIGFVTGFRVPARPDTWFVWQISIAEEARGQGLARRLLEHVLNAGETRTFGGLKQPSPHPIRPHANYSKDLRVNAAANAAYPMAFRRSCFQEWRTRRNVCTRLDHYQNLNNRGGAIT